MPRPNYKGYEQDEIPPENFSQDGNSGEKVFEQDPWKETEEVAVTPEMQAQDKVRELLIKKAATGVSEPVQAVPETVEEYKKVDPSNPKRIKGRSEAQRKSDWRKNNRDHYLAKNREYVKAWRERRAQSKG